MPSVCFTSHSSEETRELGRIIGERVNARDIIFLTGPLGAGKTCLAQGISLGLGITEGTASPSYVLMREFKGRLPLYHMDLYRLNFEEIGDLGLDDYLYGQGVCVIEWAEKGAGLMPAEHLLIRLRYSGENVREIDISSRAKHYDYLTGQIFDAWTFARGTKK